MLQTANLGLTNASPFLQARHAVVAHLRLCRPSIALFACQGKTVAVQLP